MKPIFDVAIIGGGINGCGCAADAALRGLSVALIEQGDLASKTSSSSTKLIHGGLRYLEHYEFSLVKKALIERQRLLKLAPYLVTPQSFVLPHRKYMRPSWLIRTGLFVYDNLSRKNHLPHCQTIKRINNELYFSPLTDTLNKAFLFYDGATDDARLTIVNAMQARQHGAQIHLHTKLVKAEVQNNIWLLTLQSQNKHPYTLKARALVNATGPWVQATTQITNTITKQQLSFVKGSHILVPALYQGDHAYLLQNDDKRIVFVIPYHGYSMIGTTDVNLPEPVEYPEISTAEINYLLQLVNSYFKTQINFKDICYSWSGIRPLLAGKNEDASSLSRDYLYELSKTPAPAVTIFGGKITTYRLLAKEVIDQFRPLFPHMPKSLTAVTPLPGAELPNSSMHFEQYKKYAKEQYSWIEPHILNRYLKQYGCNTEKILAATSHNHSLGQKFSPDLYQAEVDYLIKEEWAQSSEDILFRRTRLHLAFSAQNKEKLEQYIQNASLFCEKTIEST